MQKGLGAKMRELRRAKGWTLRDAERHTKISNGYLYLLETGKVKQPRPNILHKLANAFEVDYQSVMEWAGYLVETSKRQKSYGVALSSTLNDTLSELKEDELSKVADYISFIKSQRSR
jgi:transcriptional regulator with XRE-family HTH domain